MPQEQPFYIWRCARCSYHFANIAKVEGSIREEKKCPKCKALNVMIIRNNEITLQCKLTEAGGSGFSDNAVDSYGFREEEF